MPYIGYFQLLNYVDKYVVYDNIQFTKKGWINRNRILANGKDELISLTLKKDSDYLDINKRFLSDDWEKAKSKLLSKIKNAYTKAPFYKEIMPFVEDCFNCPHQNLFDFILYSIKKTCLLLDIKTEIIASSEVEHNFELKSTERVIDICKALAASQYINPIGGVDLYDKEYFNESGLALHFLKANKTIYKQFDNEFIPYLSILDILFFVPLDEVKTMIKNDFEVI